MFQILKVIRDFNHVCGIAAALFSLAPYSARVGVRAVSQAGGKEPCLTSPGATQRGSKKAGGD